MPPHFHAIYGEHEALIDILTSQVIAGALPRRAQSLVNEWTNLHRDELRELWDLANQATPLKRIDPLP